jgi:hypothetical protein
MRYKVYHSGWCCDVGPFGETHLFDSFEEAQDFYEAWKKDSAKGKYWSDGPDYMTEPKEDV